MSERWLFKKSRRERYKVRDDEVKSDEVNSEKVKIGKALTILADFCQWGT